MQNKAKPKMEFSIDYNLTNIVNDESRPTIFHRGDELIINLEAITAYAINTNSLSVKLGDLNITDNCIFTNGNTDEEGQILTGTVTIPSTQTKLANKGDVLTISIEAFEIIKDLVFPVVYTLTNVNKVKAPTSFRNGDNLEIILSALDGYQLNASTLNITLGSKNIDNRNIITDEVYDDKGQLMQYTLNIDSNTTNSAVEGDSLIINLSAIEIYDVYTITYNLSNITGPNKNTIIEGEDFIGTFTAPSLAVVDKNSIIITIGGSSYTNWTTTDTAYNEDGPSAISLLIPANDITGNISITMASKESYWTIQITKSSEWTYQSGATPMLSSNTIDEYHVEKNATFEVSYRFATDADYIFANAVSFFDKENNEYKQWNSNNGVFTMQLNSVKENISTRLSITEKQRKTITFENLNNAKFIITSDISQPSDAAELKEYYVSGDSITVWQNTQFYGYVWPLNEIDTTESILNNYNYTATAYMGNNDNLFSANTIRLPYEAASSDKFGVVDNLVINATFVSKNTSPIQVVFNDQNAVSASVNINGSVNTFTNNVNSASGSFEKNGYNLYYDQPEPALDLVDEFDTISMSGASDADQAVDRIHVEFGMSTSAAMTDMKYKITGISYSNDGGNSWTDIGGESQESFIESTAYPVSAEYYIDTAYIKNMTIVKIHVSILQQDAVTVTINCDDHSYVKYNGTNRSNLTLTYPYGSTINLLPLHFDEYYTFESATASDGTPSISETGGIYYLNVGEFTKDLIFEIKSKANYWTVTNTIDTNSISVLTDIPTKVTKGESVTFQYRTTGGFKYDYSKIYTTVGGNKINNWYTYDYDNDLYTATIQTTEESGDVAIYMTPSLKSQIPFTFNSGDTSYLTFNTAMEDKYFVNIEDKTRKIENGNTIYFYDNIPLIGTITMNDEYVGDAKNRRWSVFNITKNADGSLVDLTDSNVAKNGEYQFDINCPGYGVGLTNPQGYTLNVYHVRNYTSKVIYEIHNTTNTDYDIFLNGTNGFASSDSGSSINASCLSVAFGNNNPSKWMTMPITSSSEISVAKNSTVEIDRIKETQIFTTGNEYNSNTPAIPGYVNWGSSDGSTTISNGVNINAWLALFPAGSGYTQEEAIIDSNIKWGISYQVSNDAGQNWSNIATADEPYNIADLNTTLEARIGTAPEGYTTIAGKNSSGNYEDGLLKIIITITNTYY